MAVGVVQKADLFHLAVNNGNDVWKVLTLPPGSGNELTKLSSPIIMAELFGAGGYVSCYYSYLGSSIGQKYHWAFRL